MDWRSFLTTSVIARCGDAEDRLLLGDPCPESLIAEAEDNLRIKIPAELADFYRAANGAGLETPAGRLWLLLPIEDIGNGEMFDLEFDNAENVFFFGDYGNGDYLGFVYDEDRPDRAALLCLYDHEQASLQQLTGTLVDTLR